jgi:hypothetical protein
MEHGPRALKKNSPDKLASSLKMQMEAQETKHDLRLGNDFEAVRLDLRTWKEI